MKIAGLILALIVAVVLLLLMGGCSAYRQVVTLDEAAARQWAQVENQLQRRFDLIPNLVETVRGYATHEREIFQRLAEARQGYFSAPTSDAKAQAAGAVESALSRLLALQENYPTLRANEGFLKLQDQLEGSENRLVVERARYNEAVEALNGYLRRPFGMLGNLLARVEPREYFKAPEAARSVPRVDFSTPPAPAPAPAPAAPPAARLPPTRGVARAVSSRAARRRSPVQERPRGCAAVR